MLIYRESVKFRSDRQPHIEIQNQSPLKINYYNVVSSYNQHNQLNQSFHIYITHLQLNKIVRSDFLMPPLSHYLVL